MTTGTTGSSGTTAGWCPVVAYDALLPERGVAALLPGGVQVAVFRLADGSLHAVGNRDPRSGANVVSRGIVGTRGDRPTVAAPLFKQVFYLDTGQGADDTSEALPVHPVRLRDGRVEVGARVPVAAAP